MQIVKIFININKNQNVLFIDTVASSVQNTVEASKNIAQSSVDTGKQYITSAKGIFITIISNQ